MTATASSALAGWPDLVGLIGVALILAAYAASTRGRLPPRGAPSLMVNFIGASCILVSLLAGRFNLSAAVVEAAWALVALAGLLRLGLGRLRAPWRSGSGPSRPEK